MAHGKTEDIFRCNEDSLRKRQVKMSSDSKIPTSGGARTPTKLFADENPNW
jgi:hypothetical protein